MFVSPNTPSAISFKSKRKRTKGSKKSRIDSLAKTLNIFIRKNAIKLGNDAADDEKHTQTRKLLRQAYKGTLRSGWHSKKKCFHTAVKNGCVKFFLFIGFLVCACLLFCIFAVRGFIDSLNNYKLLWSFQCFCNTPAGKLGWVSHSERMTVLRCHTTVCRWCHTLYLRHNYFVPTHRLMSSNIPTYNRFVNRMLLTKRQQGNNLQANRHD